MIKCDRTLEKNIQMHVPQSLSFVLSGDLKFEPKIFKLDLR